MPAFMRSKNRRIEQHEDSSCELASWRCWQCSFIGNNSDELSFHLDLCQSENLDEDSNLLGCPYCTISEECHSKTCFNVHQFTEHARKYHPEITSIICPYCAIEMKPVNLLRLTQHIMFYHKIYWRPSPYSLAHLRCEKIQRDITCIGCGFTAHQIIENDQVTPPPSYLTHVQLCSQNGASITDKKFDDNSNLAAISSQKALIDKLNRDCQTISAHFTQRFPLSRGFIDYSDSQLTTLSYMNIKELPETIPGLCDIKCPIPFMPNVSLTSNQIVTTTTNQGLITFENPMNSQLESIVVNLGEQEPSQEPFTYTIEVQNKSSSNPKQDGTTHPYLLDYSTENGEQILLPLKEEESIENASERIQKAKKIRNKSLIEKPVVTSTKLTKFDVPLDMPPEPANAEVLRKKKNPDGRVFVCPTCGASTFISLRERDEHIEKEHNGELVFPCQLCGMAYPLYIALRRHAVLKHSAQYEAVLYGLMPENEPNECPKCKIVAFSDPVVLKMHLAIIHNFDVDEKPKKVTKIKTTESEEEYAPTPDEDHSDDNRKKIQSSIVKKCRARGKSRGRPPMINSLGTFTSRQSSSSYNSQREDELYSPSRNYSKNTTPSRMFRSGNRRARGSLTQRGQNSSLRGRCKDPTIYGEKTRYEKFCEKNVNPDQEKVEPTITELEEKLADVSPSSAVTLCTECHLEVQNHRELLLHNELEHNPSQAERHMGCSVCGRVFFGQHGKFDLIGHLKISHQLQQQQLQQGQEGTAERPFTCSHPQCLGMFTSIRLKSLHQCPIRHLPSYFLQAAQHLSNFLDGMPVLAKVLATELLADQSGCYILAYGCPDCGYIFTGDNATSRYVKHRKDGSCNLIMLSNN